VPDKLGLKLRAPWGSALAGRSAISFKGIELMQEVRSFLGFDVNLWGKSKRWTLRGFVGVSDTMPRLDRFPNDGSTGPFQLTGVPLLPGSDRVEIETIDSHGLLVARQ